MAKTDDLTRCKTARELVRYAERHGGYIDRQTGSHAIVKGPSGGICPVPMHAGELAGGTRRSIVKMFRAIGLVVVVLIGILSQIL